MIVVVILILFSFIIVSIVDLLSSIRPSSLSFHDEEFNFYLMETFVVALMMDDVSVWTSYFWDGGEENDGGGAGEGKWGGGNWDGGSVHVLLRIGWFWSEGDGY